MGDSVFDNVNWFTIENAELRFSLDFGTDVLGGKNISTLTLLGRCRQLMSGFDDFGEVFGNALLSISVSDEASGKLNVLSKSEQEDGEHLAHVWFPITQDELNRLVSYFALGKSPEFSATVQYADKRNLSDIVNNEIAERMRISVSQIRVGT